MVGNAERQRYWRLTGRGALPIRPERHVAGSIPTLRRRLTVALVQRPTRCLCCARTWSTNNDEWSTNVMTQ